MSKVPLRSLQVLLLLALVRHLALAFHVHPYADDFSYAVAGIRVQLFARLVHEYTSWNGRYFSNLLLLRGPLILGLEEGLVLYRSVAVAMIMLTWFAAFRFVRVLLEPASYELGATIALIFLLLFLHVMPDASEGFYWYTGGMTYQLPNALSLLLIANWMEHARRGWSSGPMWFAIQLLLVMVIMGCNELHMTFLALGHAALLMRRRHENGTSDRSVLVMCFFVLVCALVVVIAPGNDTRGALFPLRHDPIRTAGFSVAQTIRFAGKWLLLSPLGIFTLALIALHRARGLGGMIDPWLKRANRWWALALPFLLIGMTMVLVYWPTGLLGQYRTVNVALFYFIPAWFFAALVWDVQVFRSRGWVFPDARTPVLQWTLVAFCGISFLAFGRDGKLTEDLLSGRAQRYDRDIEQGYSEIASAVRIGADQIELTATEVPHSLHILPLNASPDHWTNRSLADYFGNAALEITVQPPAE